MIKWICNKRWEWNKDIEPLITIILLIILLIGVGYEKSQQSEKEYLWQLKQSNITFIDGEGDIVDKKAEIHRIESE